MATPPTQAEIRKLPRRAKVALAARCARRSQPIFALLWPDAPAGCVEAVDRAICLAENFAAGLPTVASEVDAASIGTIAVVQGARAAARDTLAPTKAAAFEAAADAANTAWVAARATAAAIKAVESSKIAAQISLAPDRNSPNADWRVFAGRADIADTDLAGAAVANANNAGIFAKADIEPLIAAEIRATSEAAVRGQWTNDTVVPPEFFGPMWPHGLPEGWPTDDVPATGSTSSILHVEFRIPPGIDRDAANERIARILVALSDRHRELGGSGLRIVDGHAYDGAPIHKVEPPSDGGDSSGSTAYSDLEEAGVGR